MRAGLTTSVILHVVALGFGLLSLKAPAAFDVADVESLPVDIVPLSALTQIQEGDKKATMREKAAPTPTKRPDVVADARKTGDNSVDTDKPPTPDAKPKPVETSSAPPPAPTPVEKPKEEDAPKPKETPKPTPATEVAPQPQPKEEVKPDPVKQAEPKPEPVKQPQPAPDKPDAVAEAIAAEQPQEDVKLPDQAPAPDARPKPAPAETAKAPERRDSEKPVKEASSRQQSQDKSLDDKISALLNKEKASGGGAKRSNQQASLGGEKSTGGDKLSQNEMDALRQKLAGCWSINPGTIDADQYKVSVRFHLDSSGQLQDRPQVVKGGAASGPGRIAAESAVRAVQKCAPFNLPSDKYDTWSEIVVNFDPSDMF